MNTKKVVFLFLALLLPISIFVFLKLFGKNEFDVPQIHQDSIAFKLNGCNYNYKLPYQVPDSLIKKLNPNRAGSLIVINFDEQSSLLRIKEEFTDAVTVVSGVALTENKVLLRHLRECVLIMQPETDIVLIDKDRRIRGYYKASDRDEVDRLLLEMKIILKQY